MIVDKVPKPVLAVLSGVLLGFSQPMVIEALGDDPIDRSGLTGCLALVGLIPLLLAIRGEGPKRAYWLGFLALFVQFTMNVQWLVVAMVVFGGIPLVFSWLILSLLTSAMAAYVAAAFAVTRLLVARYRWPQWLVFPVAFTCVEVLRNFGPIGGFPWGNIGTSFATVPLLLQPAALFGVHGLVFLAAALSSSVAEVVARRDLRAAGAAAGIAVLWLGYGAARLSTEPSDAPTVKVGLLQGNIEQGIRNDVPWTGRTILDRYHALSDEAVREGAQIVVWPEAAFPLRLKRNITRVPDVAGNEAPRAAVVGAVGTAPGGIHSNSAFILGAHQEVVGRVDKTHLVPFGEYVPWPLGAIVKQIVPIGNTEPGDDYKGIPVKVTTSAGERELSLGTTICYEGIFPEIARNLRKGGAELHINITNDGWYGISGAPTQHLDFYALRAVESGMPVIRAANTGRSGWVDTRGRIHDATAIYTDKAVIADVPLVLENTLYVALGEWLGVPCVVFTLLAWFYAMLGADVLRRKRAPLENALGFGGVVVAVAAAATYFAMSALHHDEANATRFLVLVLFALLVGLGALSQRPWGRKAQLVVGVLLVLTGLIATFVWSPVMLAQVAAGALLFGVQLRRKDVYARAKDIVVVDEDVDDPPPPAPAPTDGVGGGTSAAAPTASRKGKRKRK